MTAEATTVYVIDTGSAESEPKRDLYVQSLDGRAFRLVLTWRERQSLWYLDLYSSDGTALLLGAAMQPGSPLLLRRQGAEWPGGALILHDLSDANEPCTLAGLGVTHELTYLPAAVIAAWREAQAATSTLTIEAV